ncbi:MAG: hypothetical protein KBD21_03000 [Candidatus Pacebacteria bacterium]|nr:hypothetical protein [Candidatus Paceibacterota bacterium]
MNDVHSMLWRLHFRHSRFSGMVFNVTSMLLVFSFVIAPFSSVLAQ